MTVKIPPTCPYDDFYCKVTEMWPNFEKHQEGFLGVLPVCRVCVEHKKLGVLKNIENGLERLRATAF